MDSLIVFLFCEKTALHIGFAIVVSILLFVMLSHFELMGLRLNKRILVICLIPLLVCGTYFLLYYSQQGAYYRFIDKGNLQQAYYLTQDNSTKHWAKGYPKDVARRLKIHQSKPIPIEALLFLVETQIIPNESDTLNRLLHTIVNRSSNDWATLRRIRQCKNLNSDLASEIDVFKHEVTISTLSMLTSRNPNSLIGKIYSGLAENYSTIDTIYVVYKLLGDEYIVQQGNLSSQSVYSKALPFGSLLGISDASVRKDYENGLKRISGSSAYPIADSILAPFIVHRIVTGSKDGEIKQSPRIEIEMVVRTSSNYYKSNQEGDADIYGSSVTGLAYDEIELKYYDFRNQSELFSIGLETVIPSSSLEHDMGESRATALINNINNQLWEEIHDALFGKDR